MNLVARYSSLKGSRKPAGGRLSPMSGMAEGISGAGARGAEAFGRGTQATTNELGEFISPLTREEIDRLGESGLDRGHLSSLALYFGAGAAASKGSKGVKKAAQAVKGARRASKEDLGVGTRGTNSANMAGTIQDPMAQYAAYLALTNRR